MTEVIAAIALLFSGSAIAASLDDRALATQKVKAALQARLNSMKDSEAGALTNLALGKGSTTSTSTYAVDDSTTVGGKNVGNCVCTAGVLSAGCTLNAKCTGNIMVISG